MNRYFIAHGFVLVWAVAAVCFTSSAAQGDILLYSDSCYTTTSATNVNQDIAARTTGKYAGTGYTYYSGNSATRVGESTYDYEVMRLGPGNYSSSYGYVWFNQQLKGDDSAGGLDLAWTASAYLSSGTAYGASWFTVGVGADSIGATSSTRPLLNSGTTGGVFLGFRLGDGGTNESSPCKLFVYEKGVNMTPTELVWHSSALEVPAVNHTFVMRVTGVGSNNPFSATTPLNIKLYVDGDATPLLNYTTVNNYPNNYIGMMSYGYCRFNIDSWSATQIPEPSTLALLAGSLVGVAAYAWRKRR
jgi:hypothetical protein